MSAGTFRVSLLTIIAVFFSLSANAEKEPWPETTADGLKLVWVPDFAVVYVKPGADPKNYTKIMIQDPVVRFKKDKVGDEKWATDNQSGAPTTEETLSVRNKISKKFYEIFTKKMTERGYELVDEPAAGVLLIRPAIINLRLIAPETQGAGEVTLYFELFDSVTGERLSEGWDTRKDQSVDNGLKNWALEANRDLGLKAFDAWAKAMSDALIKVQQHPIPWEPGVIY